MVRYDNLTPHEVARLREQAAARVASNRFVDPGVLSRIHGLYPSREWLEHVLGTSDCRPLRSLPYPQMVLVALAADADPAGAAWRPPRKPEPPSEAAVQAEREHEAWKVLRARLPVAVFVGHNWSIGHHESGHVTGRDHIVVQTALHAGRWRRDPHTALCETPSVSRRGVHIKNPLRYLDRSPEQAGPADPPDRTPTCRACLSAAQKIAVIATPGESLSW